jgi:hypothetical protein
MKIKEAAWPHLVSIAANLPCPWNLNPLRNRLEETHGSGTRAGDAITAGVGL